MPDNGMTALLNLNLVYICASVLSDSPRAAYKYAAIAFLFFSLTRTSSHCSRILSHTIRVNNEKYSTMGLFALAILAGAVGAAHRGLPHESTSPRFVAQLSAWDDSPRGFLFRGDSQRPEVVFHDGLQSPGTNLVSLRRSATSAVHYADGDGARAAEQGADSYLYVVSPEGLANSTAYYYPNTTAPVHEVSTLVVNGSLGPETIVGVYTFRALPDEQYRVQQWLANPNYEYQDRSPYASHGRSCLEWACPRARHLASTLCSGIVSCFRSRGPELEPRAYLEESQEVHMLYPRRVQCVSKQVMKQLLPAEDAKSPVAAHQPGPQTGSIVKHAEEISQKEFDRLVKQHKLDGVVAKVSKTGSDARKLFAEYQPLSEKSPKLRPALGALAKGSLAVLAGGAWVADVVDAFVHNVTALRRVNAVAQGVPLAGCATAVAAGVESKESAAALGVDAGFCFLGDAFLLSGALAPVGVLVHLLRAALHLYGPPPEPPSLEEMKKSRDEQWQDYLKKGLFTYVYSHESLRKEGNFASKLEYAFAAEDIMVISEGAQEIGVLQATSQAAGPDEDNKQAQAGSQNATEGIRRAISDEIRRRRQEALLDLPAMIVDKSAASMKATAKELNDKLAKDLISHETLVKYTGLEVEKHVPDQGRRPSQEARIESLKKKMASVGEDLEKDKPADSELV
ncbi:uncharacterized protein MAM_07725 [Metarhizium album ARSEF 1941]|uniref:Heat-labile enterotoxin, A chain n=1 Tax=Metarhizium album (strain ARSEF 1941) TaxID=1081103 RepID=A0A0B2WL42_METAS|nr:uncharacterized protein MAM_07725 [Metarhizium album ARSEF 1941]KHN94409.1 hypothetical protein MAM_07725 [Metarhizium album ARSEF 1941]